MAKKNVIRVSSALAGIVLISVVSAIALRGDKGPDFTGKSPEEIKEYFRSDAFQKMSEKDQRAAKKRAFGPYKRQQQQAFIEQAKIYAKLPPNQKIRFLDERIDKYARAAGQKRQGNGQKTSGAAARSGSGAKGGGANAAKARAAGKTPATEGIRAWSEKTNPEDRAHIIELKEAITQRMQERGINLQ